MQNQSFLTSKGKTESSISDEHQNTTRTLDSEYVEDESLSQMSPSQVDEKTGKVVCSLHTGGDLRKDMK